LSHDADAEGARRREEAPAMARELDGLSIRAQKFKRSEVERVERAERQRKRLDCPREDIGGELDQFCVGQQIARRVGVPRPGVACMEAGPAPAIRRGTRGATIPPGALC
jgi:hypothetical protein